MTQEHPMKQSLHAMTNFLPTVFQISQDIKTMQDLIDTYQATDDHLASRAQARIDQLNRCLAVLREPLPPRKK